MDKDTSPGLERSVEGRKFMKAVLQHQVIISGQAQKIREAQTTIDALSTAIELMETKYKELQESLTDVDCLHTGNARTFETRLNNSEATISQIHLELMLLRRHLKEFKDAPPKKNNNMAAIPLEIVRK